MGLLRKAYEVVVGFLADGLGFVTGVAGLNMPVTLHFEIAVAATAGGIQYIPVPQGTKVSLMPSNTQQGIIDNAGNVTFSNVSTIIWFHVRLTEFTAVRYPDAEINLPSGYEWDSEYENFYHERVAADAVAGQALIHGSFMVGQLNGMPVTFRVRGYPIHAKFTYSFLSSQPTFHGDRGRPEPIQSVPIPAGIKVTLQWELASGPLENLLTRSLIEGRTKSPTNSNDINETVWNTVLYQPLDPVPASFPKPIRSFSIHVMMDMENRGLGLKPVRVHGLQFAIPVPPEPWELPIIEIMSPTQNVDLGASGQFDKSFGTIGNPFLLDINENTTQVGIPPEAPVVPLVVPLGHLAIFQLQAITDVHYWFWLLSANAGGKDRYEGFEMDLYLWHTPWGALNTVSLPPQIIQSPTLFLEEKHWDVHSVVAHEFAHQISYARGFRFGGSTGEGLLDALREFPVHFSTKRTSEDVALLEGWAEFVEGLFGRDDGLGMIEQFWTWKPPDDNGQNADWTNLWDIPGEGTKIEGCIARAFFQIYRTTHDIHAHPNLIGTFPPASFPDPNHPGNLIFQSRAFDDALTANGIFDPADPVLSNVFIDFIGANKFALTDSSGFASISSPRAVTGVMVAQGVVVCAALTQTSRLDSMQVTLGPLVPSDPNAIPDIFCGLFYQCWFPEFKQADEVYIRMLNYADDWGNAPLPLFYETIRMIFWNNNMLLPRVIDVPDSALGRVFQLVDVLLNPVVGNMLQARVVQSMNPLDYLNSGAGHIQGPLKSDIQFFTNGVIDVSTLTLDPLIRIRVTVDINVRNLIPDANMAGRDVWVRGVFRP